MNYRKKWHSFILVALWGAAAGCSDAAQAAGCTRTQLAATVNSYFRALSAHDAHRLPLSPHAGYTENGMPKDFGAGFWKTAGAVRLKRSALDVRTCGTVTQAVVEEGGKLVIYGVRLKLVRGRITEAETLLARSTEFAAKPQGVLDTADQDWEGILPVKDRTPRDVMIRAANDYYDMFAKEPTASVPFATPCDRWENGTRTTKGDCSPKGLVLHHPPRRVPVVDEEAGIVVAFVHFNRSLPDLHMFKMKDGKVYMVQAVIGARAPSTGWPVGEASVTHSADLAAITAFNARYLKAINTGDIAALSSLTDDDHIMIAPGRTPLVGKAANDAANGQGFQRFNIAETWNPVETVIDGNLGYQRGTFTVLATPKDGGAGRTTSGTFLRIYRRQSDGSWRMTRDMFNSGS